MRPIVLAILGGFVVLFLVFCSIFYNTPASEALSIANVSPNSGPSTGGQTVQITTDATPYKLVDGLIFTNPGTSAPNQYIDTGINQTGDVSIELKFKIADGNTCTSTGNANGTPGMRIFGSWEAWNVNSIYLSRLSGTGAETVEGNRCAFNIRRGLAVTEGPNSSSALPMGNNTSDTKVHVWRLNGVITGTTGTWNTDGGTAANLTTPNAALPNTNGVSMYLGTTHHLSSGVSGTGLAGTVYYLKLWQGSSLVRDMVPVCTANKSSCGMWDKVSQTFFGNVGSGTFTAGAFLPDEVSVTFDGVTAANASRASDNVVQATTPAHVPEVVDVVLTVNGQKATIPNGYTYRPTVSSVNPNYGPTTGGTGFGAAYNQDGTITITGNGFIQTRVKDYINANQNTGWENPTFSSATSSDPYGGTITYTGTLYTADGNHHPWHIFDKITDTRASSWVSLANNPPITATYTLPAGKYVNLNLLRITNGATSPVRYIQFYAGGNINATQLTSQIQLADASYNYPTYSLTPSTNSYWRDNNLDLWTNQLTIRVSDTWGTQTWTAVEELVLGGAVVDLNGQGISSLPTNFHLADFDVYPSAVAIGGTPCASFTVVSNTEITCKPAAHVNGVYDVAVTVDGITSTALAGDGTSDDYDYIDPMEITDISPAVGTELGGDSVTITGKGFLSSHRAGMAAQPVVTFDPDGTPADCVLVSFTDTEIVCTTAAHDRELVDVKIDNGLQTYVEDDGFLYYELYIGLASEQGDGKVSFSVLPSDSGGNSGFDTLTARTNLPTGYQLGMKTVNNTLVCSGLDVCASHWYSSVASTGSLGDDTWGYQLDYLPSPTPPQLSPTPTAWQPIPIIETTVFVKSSLTPGITDVSGDNFQLWYGAKASWFMPVTTYERTVTITAVANL
jgi:hypothetical protein